MASSLVVPIAVWHNFPNLHTTCVISRWPHVFAGQNDGTIWVYSLSATHDGQFEVKEAQTPTLQPTRQTLD